MMPIKTPSPANTFAGICYVLLFVVCCLLVFLIAPNVKANGIAIAGIVQIAFCLIIKSFLFLIETVLFDGKGN